MVFYLHHLDGDKNKLPLVPHQVCGQNWPLEGSKVSPSHEGQSFAPATRDLPSQHKVLCVHASGFISCPPSMQQRSATQFICHPRKDMFASLLGFGIRSRGERRIFLFDLLPNYSSVGEMGMKISLKILTRCPLFGEDTSRCKCIKANASCPWKGTLVE